MTRSFAALNEINVDESITHRETEQLTGYCQNATYELQQLCFLTYDVEYRKNDNAVSVYVNAETFVIVNMNMNI